jgi:hypothetical protein
VGIVAQVLSLFRSVLVALVAALPLACVAQNHQVASTAAGVLAAAPSQPALADDARDGSPGRVIVAEELSVEPPRPPLEALGPPRIQRVLLVGASSMEYYLGTELKRQLEAHRGIEVSRFAKLGTGLSRPDVFDWEKKVKALLKTERPDVVVAMFGGNDAQGLYDKAKRPHVYGTEGWFKEYRRRVDSFIRVASAQGAQVVMLGMPVMRSAKFSRRMERVNKVTREACEAAGAVYLATWDLIATPTGAYQQSITHDGETDEARLEDGIHFAKLGAKRVGERLAWRMQRHFRLTPADPALAEALRLDFESQHLARPVSYLAYVPRELEPDERLPVLYLLHGADGSYADWSDHAHASLQRLAQQHRILIVTPEGLPDSWYLDSTLLAGARAESYILQELVPHVERQLPVGTRRSIAGLSMGGHGALSLALKHPGRFVAASSMSGALDLTQATNRKALIARLGPFDAAPEVWKVHSVMHLVQAHPERARELPTLVTIGQEDRWLEANRALQNAIRPLGGQHAYGESPGTHGWDYWTGVLEQHVTWHVSHLHPAALPESARLGKVGTARVQARGGNAAPRLSR